MSRAAACLLVFLAAAATPAQASHLTGLPLAAGGLSPGDQFGAAVAVADTRIAVGAHAANGGRGAVYVFRRATPNGPWVQDGAPLSAPPGFNNPDARFGFDVALDPEGTRLLVGAPGAGGCGAAFLIDLEPRGAPRQLGIRPCDPGSEVGSAVALSDQAMAVGARRAEERAGRVYFSLDRDGSSFDQLPIAGLAPLGELGQSLALSGLLLVAGAPAPYPDARSPGRAFVTDLGSRSTTELLPGLPLANGAAFGYSVAISGGGDIAVGAPFHPAGGGGGTGAVFQFARIPGTNTWSRPEALLAFPAGEGDQLGVAVALDGGLLVAGARYAGIHRAGAAYVHGHGALADPEPEDGAQFGFATAVHGETVVVGAFQKSRGRGAAYVFEEQLVPAVTLSVTESVREGDRVKVRVTADSTLQSEIAVQVVVEAGTPGAGEVGIANAGEDIVLSPPEEWRSEGGGRWVRTLSLRPAQRSVGFEIPTTPDPDCEGDETFSVSLAGSPAARKVTIVDNDPGDIVLPAGLLTVVEGAPPVELPVKLGCPPRGQVTVSLAATAGAVVLYRTQLTFTPDNWDTPQTVQVSGPDDAACDDTARPFTIAAATTSAAPRYRAGSVFGENRNDDRTCVTGTMEVCTFADDTVIYEITLSNGGAVAQEDLVSFELLDVLPAADLTVVTASATDGVATVDYAANAVAWNGRIPADSDPGSDPVTITIVAALEPGVDPGKEVRNDAARLTFDRDGRLPVERLLISPSTFAAGVVSCPP